MTPAITDPHADRLRQIRATGDLDLIHLATYPPAMLKLAALGPNRPRIVCLCGSTRFGEAFRELNLRLTLDGVIVLSIGCDTKSDDHLWSDPVRAAQIKAELDELHKRKIDLADEVLVLNVGGYIGESTRSEIEYARRLGKPISYLEPAPAASSVSAATPNGA